jgi:hypothetical protein
VHRSSTSKTPGGDGPEGKVFGLFPELDAVDFERA